MNCDLEEWRRLQNLAMAVLDLEMDCIAYKNRLKAAKGWLKYCGPFYHLEFKLQNIIDQLDEFRKKVFVEWNECDQKGFRCSFEILGIPEGMVKSNKDITRMLSHVLNVSIDDCKVRGFDIISAFRVQRLHPVYIPTRVLAVHMTKRRYCRRILKLAGTNPHRLPNQREPIYFSEHLTYVTRKTLHKTTETANRFGLEYVGIRHGKVYVQKTKTSKLHCIRGEMYLGSRFYR